MSNPSQAPTPGMPAASPAVDQNPTDRHLADEDLVEQDLLVEEVSIDGMCGVY